MNRNTSLPLENCIPKSCEPLDLVSFTKIIYKAEYRFVKLSKLQLDILEEQGYFKSYEKIGKIGKFVSLAEIQKAITSYYTHSPNDVLEYFNRRGKEELTLPFIQYAMANGVDYFLREDQVPLFNIASFKIFIGRCIAASVPLDLVTHKHLMTPEYKHLRLSRSQLNSLEEQGYFPSYKHPTKGYRLYSLVSLESVITVFYSFSAIEILEYFNKNNIRMTLTFINFAMKKGVDYIVNSNSVPLFNQSSFEVFVNECITSSIPLDLVNWFQIDKKFEYKHVKMTKKKIRRLEKFGYIEIYNEKDTEYFSLTQLEAFVKKEREESQTLITKTALVESKHYNLDWNKAKELLDSGELEVVETLYGHEAITLSSVKRYINNLKTKEIKDLVTFSDLKNYSKYKHVRLTRKQIKLLENKGYLKTYEVKGIKYSLSELESAVTAYYSHSGDDFLKSYNARTSEKMTFSFIKYAIEKGTDYFFRDGNLYFNKDTFEIFVEECIANSVPVDLINLNQVKEDPQYQNIKMSYEKLYNLEARGFVTFYIARYRYISFSQLEAFVKKEREESQTLITKNALAESKLYNLNWKKVDKLIGEGKLELVETLYGDKAIAISSVEQYINNRDDQANGRYEPINEILKKRTDDLTTKSFIAYAIEKDISHKKIGNQIFINNNELQDFIRNFKSSWIARKELIKSLNVDRSYLYKLRKEHSVITIVIGGKLYYQRSSVKLGLETLTLEQKRLDQQKKLKEKKRLEFKKYKKEGKILIVEAQRYLRDKGLSMNSTSDFLKLCSQMKIAIYSASDDSQLVLREQILDLPKKLVNFPICKENLNHYNESNINLIKIDNKEFIQKEDFNNFISDFYYDITEAREILRVSHKCFKKIERTYLTSQDYLMLGKNSYYIKKKIDELFLRQESYLNEWMDYKEEWMTFREALNLLDRKRLYHFSKVNPRIKTLDVSVNTDLLVSSLILKKETGKQLYKRADVKKIVEEIDENSSFDKLDISDPIQVFHISIKEIYNLKFKSFACQSEEIWFGFVKRRLYKSKANEPHMRSLIKQLINCTELLINATSEEGKEIFGFSSNDINTYLFSPQEIPNDYKKIFRTFFKELYTQLQDIAKIAGRKTFNINNLIFDFDAELKTKKKSIYKFREYLELFDYANDLNLHKTLAIDDVRLNIQGSSCSRYDSIWLYIIVNLNNPWNHGEILNLPRINLLRTEIVSLEWLEHNSLSDQDVKEILRQYKLWDSKREKTGVAQNFHISSELELAFATAASICEFRRQKESLLVEQNQTLIDFKLKTAKHQLKPSHKPYVSFFEHFNGALVYENLKLARTLISFKYIVITEFIKPGDGEDESIKFDRGHKDIKTTNIYVQIPQEHLDFLCKQLFTRGLFGNVYYNLSEMFYGKETNREIQTEKIQNLKELLGNLLRVESIAGVLNQLQLEENVVNKTLFTLDKSLTDSYYKKLSCNAMPAKERDYQCLNYPNGCLYPERNSCAICPLSIANYLVIMRVVDEVMEVVHKVKASFKDANEHERTVMANNLNQALLNFGACASRFSEENINEFYSFISINREDFLTFLAELPNFKQYITYKSKLLEV